MFCSDYRYHVVYTSCKQLDMVYYNK